MTISATAIGASRSYKCRGRIGSSSAGRGGIAVIRNTEPNTTHEWASASNSAFASAVAETSASAKNLPALARERRGHRSGCRWTGRAWRARARKPLELGRPIAAAGTIFDILISKNVGKTALPLFDSAPVGKKDYAAIASVRLAAFDSDNGRDDHRLEPAAGGGAEEIEAMSDAQDNAWLRLLPRPPQPNPALLEYRANDCPRALPRPSSIATEARAWPLRPFVNRTTPRSYCRSSSHFRSSGRTIS